MRDRVGNFRIRVITYNVASVYPEEDLQELLGIDSPVKVEGLPNVFAIG